MHGGWSGDGADVLPESILSRGGAGAMLRCVQPPLSLITKLKGVQARRVR